MKSAVSSKPTTADPRAICDSPLEKIIFPFVGIRRAELDNNLPRPLAKSKLTFTAEGSIQGVDHPTNGHNYVVLTLKLHANAKSQETDEVLVTIALTCLGYFRCDKGHTPEAIEAYFDAEEEGYAKKCIAQIYPTAVFELERLVRQAGLPAMNLALSAPSNVNLVKEEIKPTSQAPARGRRTPTKKAKPAKQ
ncbi:hypothetical protein [Achromobacter sp. KK8]|jgi:hypothetical protein